jgi:hypothetical protein
MHANRAPRYCRCGARLGRYNPRDLCSLCETKLAVLRAKPPDLPAGFWDTTQFHDAFAAQHIGQVSRAYRKHPHHRAVYGKDGIPQSVVAGWLGLTQTQISRIETGPPVRQLDSLVAWARTLGIPESILWFRLPRQQSALADPADDPRPDLVREGKLGSGETDDMNRRKLLRLVAMAGAALAGPLDWERVEHATRTDRLDSETLDGYSALNGHLWHAFVLSAAKASTMPLVREQLNVLVSGMCGSRSSAQLRRLCTLAADLFQLAGEIYFDGNRYTEAAHCYALAASAAREAEAFDIWACALTRHAFIEVYEKQHAAASPMLDLAAGIARRGDGTLSTRHWVAAVQAEAFAGLGQLNECQRSLDAAERVHELTRRGHNGGWLRFDGSRLAEQRGTCYVELYRPDLAETALTSALAQHLSTRRRAAVLVDLAMVGVQRRDLNLLLTNADAALNLARQTGSGVICHRLRGLRGRLTPLLQAKEIRYLDQRIAAVAGVTT